LEQNANRFEQSILTTAGLRRLRRQRARIDVTVLTTQLWRNTLPVPQMKCLNEHVYSPQRQKW